MRIVQAVALFAPDFNGGASLVCRRLGEALVGRGHTVDVLSGFATPDEPTGAVHRSALGELGTWRVNVGGAFDPASPEGFLNPFADAAFGQLLETIRPDVVHLHSLQGLGVGLIHEAARQGVPVVLTMHDWWWLCPCLFRLSPAGWICPRVVDPERCSGGAYPREMLERRRAALAQALARVERILVPSAYLRDDLVANGLPAGRIEVQENGLPPPGPQPGAEAGPAEAGVRLLFVGGAGNRAKGLEVLLEAAVLLGEAPFRLRCHAVAPEEARPWSERLGTRLECRPAFAPAEIDSVIRSADLLVLPSRMRESFSLVAREALARGLPVVTSDCGGPEEVVRDGVNGRVFASDSAADLAAVLRDLIADPTAVARLRPDPRPRFRTPDEQAAAAEQVYRSLLRTRSAPRRSGAVAELAGRRVLFLTGIDGAPLRYRVWHLVERLRALGVGSEVLYHSDIRALGALRVAHLVVLFRAPYSATVAAVVAEARRRGLPVVFSADDLVFSTELGGDAPVLEDPADPRAHGFRETLEMYARSAQAADAFLGSTPELVDAAATLGLPGFVERNRLGAEWLAAVEESEKAAAAGPRGPGTPVWLGYFSGTDTHDGDLAQIAGPLARVLARAPHARLVLGGPLQVPAELRPYAARIERRPFVPWSDLAASLRSVDLNLAPLDISRRFNRAKSEVKYLEAAALGIPTIASPSPAFRYASDDGRTALLAETAAEWEAVLGQLVEDRDVAIRLGETARRDVYGRYAPDAGLEELSEWVAGALGTTPRSSPLPSPIVLEAGGGSSVALEPAQAPYDAYQLAYEHGDPLRPGSEIEQSFTCRRDGLSRVDVRVGTYARRNHHEVFLTITDEEGRRLGARSVPAEQLVDGSFVAVELDEPLADSRGRTLRLQVAAPGATPGNEILLWRARSSRGGLRIGGRPCEGFELSYRSFTGVAA